MRAEAATPVQAPGRSRSYRKKPDLAEADVCVAHVSMRLAQQSAHVRTRMNAHTHVRAHTRAHASTPTPNERVQQNTRLVPPHTA